MSGRDEVRKRIHRLPVSCGRTSTIPAQIRTRPAKRGLVPKPGRCNRQSTWRRHLTCPSRTGSPVLILSWPGSPVRSPGVGPGDRGRRGARPLLSGGCRGEAPPNRPGFGQGHGPTVIPRVTSRHATSAQASRTVRMSPPRRHRPGAARSPSSVRWSKPHRLSAWQP